MDRWTLKPNPSPRDPARHILCLKGDMKDVLTLVRRFGALCGRPSRFEGPGGFDYSLFLHGVSVEKLTEVETVLREIFPGASPAPAPVPAPAPPPPPPTPAPAPPPPPPTPVPEPAPAPPPTPVPVPPPPPPPPPSPPPVPEAAGAQIKMEPPPAPSPAPVSPPPPSPAAAMSAPPAQARPPRPMWGLEIPLDPKRDFESLQVGAFNRFAHAASTSAIGSPGTMYNPLFLYGPAGVGKTHMITAIGQGVKKALGDARVILTSGTRLSGAATLAAAEGKLPELEAALKGAKALLVDDLHLLAVNEKNQAFLGQIFAHYFKSNLQVVFTSLYPARSLAQMEEALKISLAKGWSVDLKVPAAEPRRDMMTSAFSRNGVEFTQDEVGVFMDRIADKQAECRRWAKRLLTIKAIREAASEPTPIDKILTEIFTTDAGPEGQELPTAPDIDAAAKFSPPPPGKNTKNLAIFLPKAHEALMTWVVSRFHETKPPYDKELGYRHVLLQTYDADQPFGIPFQIGEAARLCGADAVLLIGPPLAAALAAKAGDFAHAVGHIVESLDAAFSWIPPGGLLSKANFFRAHLDFLAGKTE